MAFVAMLCVRRNSYYDMLCRREMTLWYVCGGEMTLLLFLCGGEMTPWCMYVSGGKWLHHLDVYSGLPVNCTLYIVIRKENPEWMSYTSTDMAVNSGSRETLPHAQGDIEKGCGITTGDDAMVFSYGSTRLVFMPFDPARVYDSVFVHASYHVYRLHSHNWHLVIHLPWHDGFVMAKWYNFICGGIQI